MHVLSQVWDQEKILSSWGISLQILGFLASMKSNWTYFHIDNYPAILSFQWSIHQLVHIFMILILRKKNLIVWSILFLSFHFIWLIIVIFVNCLTVAKKVIGRTHTLNGTIVEVSCHSITDEFQAKGGSENQVRPTV